MSEKAITMVVDTNVWLDNYLHNRDGYEAARNFFNLLSSLDIRPLYSAATLKDVFYIIASSLKTEIHREGSTLTKGDTLAIREIAWACVENMRELGTAVCVDEADLWLACKYRRLHGDLEDNLVLAAAERVHADYLVTSDAQLIRKSTVAAFTPADMATFLKTRAELV
ncbi:MAG: PIN domain-containing protein [Coriobacteriia bacterium]|nr:PIN domain-containing protein [Coriobacteriia bacterium]